MFLQKKKRFNQFAEPILCVLLYDYSISSSGISSRITSSMKGFSHRIWYNTLRHLKELHCNSYILGEAIFHNVDRIRSPSTTSIPPQLHFITVTYTNTTLARREYFGYPPLLLLRSGYLQHFRRYFLYQESFPHPFSFLQIVKPFVRYLLQHSHR